VLREVLSHAVLGGVLFTFVLFTRDLAKIVELAIRGSASLGDILRIFAYTLPSTLNLTIPVTVLVGILLGLSRLSADSEVTAMRACGLGVMSFVRIVSIGAIAALGVGLVNSLYIAPRSAAALLRLGESLKTSQASFEVQPRVFYEDFKDYVLYVQDVHPAQGASRWHHVFLADLTQPTTPHITTADQAIVVGGKGQSLRLHFRDGSQHEISAADPHQYNITKFVESDLAMQVGDQDDVRLGRSDTPLQALSLKELWRRAHGEAGRQYNIQLQERFAYPVACIVLMLVGVPLGLSSRRGGKSAGFVLTIVLVFLYYLFSSVGMALAKQGKVSPLVGVWTANVIFAVAGTILLRQLSSGGTAAVYTTAAIAWIGRKLKRFGQQSNEQESTELGFVRRLRRARGVVSNRFPLIFDDYVLREFMTNLILVVASFLTLSLIFSFFELLGDIIRNKTALVTVGEYLINLIPYMLYHLTPLSALIAVLVTFGSLSRTSELTAMKACGVSVYRLVAPVLVITAVLAAALFAFDEWYLPDANRKQEALRSEIKGKPAQTFLRPDRKWISGQQDNSSSPSRIFYYQFFDPDRDVFANLTVFEFEPETFHLKRRIFASSARWDARLDRWVLENGWQRTFGGEAISSYQPFTVSTFPEIREQPSYFKKESRQSQEMTYTELSKYIKDLKQSGFETMRLRVQLNLKIAYPLITLVMAIFAVPFALSMGKRGSLTGIATAIGMAIAYQVLASMFEALGNGSALPPLLAAWSPDLLFGFAGAYMLLRTPT